MLETEKLEFLNQLIGLSKYYKQEIDEFNIKLYWNLLKKYELIEIRSAIAGHVETCKWMPKISEISDKILSGREKKIPNEIVAMRAWDDVINKINNFGGYKTPIFTDDLINKILESMGGWKNLCELPRSEYCWKEKAFIARYISYLEYPVTNLNKLSISHDEQHKISSESMQSQEKPILGQNLEFGVDTSNIFKKIDNHVSLNDKNGQKRSNLGVDQSMVVGL